MGVENRIEGGMCFVTDTMVEWCLFKKKIGLKLFLSVMTAGSKEYNNRDSKPRWQAATF